MSLRLVILSDIIQLSSIFFILTKWHTRFPNIHFNEEIFKNIKPKSKDFILKITPNLNTSKKITANLLECFLPILFFNELIYVLWTQMSLNYLQFFSCIVFFLYQPSTGWLLVTHWNPSYNVASSVQVIPIWFFTLSAPPPLPRLAQELVNQGEEERRYLSGKMREQKWLQTGFGDRTVTPLRSVCDSCHPCSVLNTSLIEPKEIQGLFQPWRGMTRDCSSIFPYFLLQSLNLNLVNK